MFKPIDKEIKEKILTEVKDGASVLKTAGRYDVSPKTIYGWLTKQSTSSVSFLELSRLRRERDDLLKIIGRLTLELTRSKKKKADKGNG